MIPHEEFFSAFGGCHSYRSMIGGIVLFQQGIQTVDISVGVVGREILPYPCFQGPIKSF